MARHLTDAELDRIHSFLFSNEEELRVDVDGSMTVNVDADDICKFVDEQPEQAWEVFRAFWDRQNADYVFPDEYLGEYTERADGTITFAPYS